MTNTNTNLRRLATVVLDATTESPLEGVPSVELFRDVRLGQTTLAVWQDGEWALVHDADLGWRMRQGHEVRLVRMTRSVGVEAGVAL